QQIAHARHEFVEADDARREVLLAGKGEQLARQLRAALGGGAGAFQNAEDVLIARAEGGQLDIAEHRGQQIVEIVSDAAGELTDHLQLLGLAKALLYLSALGHIPDRAGETERIAVLVAIEATFGHYP